MPRYSMPDWVESTIGAMVERLFAQFGDETIEHIDRPLEPTTLTARTGPVDAHLEIQAGGVELLDDRLGPLIYRRLDAVRRNTRLGVSIMDRHSDSVSRFETPQ